jgi:hypothetical protein
MIGALVAVAVFVVAFEDSGDSEVELTVGHCWISPVEFEGQTWVVRKSEQFGWGGNVPDGWVGEGSITRVAEDQSLYEDRGGLELSLVLEDSPEAAWLKKALCA